MAEKLPHELSPETLRIRARARSADVRAPAIAELERRRGNLRNAVIPEWEKTVRGEDYRKWAVT